MVSHVPDGLVACNEGGRQTADKKVKNLTFANKKKRKGKRDEAMTMTWDLSEMTP
jgi:hypothetical protein